MPIHVLARPYGPLASDLSLWAGIQSVLNNCLLNWVLVGNTQQNKTSTHKWLYR